MKRTLEEIENEVIETIQENFKITAKEIGEKLRISPRFLDRVLNKLVREGRIN